MKLKIFSILLLFGVGLNAQVGYLYSEVDSVLIGEEFEVQLTFSGLSPEDIMSVNWDTLETLEHRSLIDSNLYDVDFDITLGNFKGDDYQFTSDELEWVHNNTDDPPSFSNTIRMTVWELCILGVAGPKITFKNGEEVRINPKYIYVKDPLLREIEGLAPSEDIIREYRTWWDIIKDNWIVFAFIAAFFILVPIAVWLSRRSKKEVVEIVEKEIEEEVVIIPAHVIALEKLNTLKTSRIWENENDKKFVSDLTDIIREYIENRFGVQALEMTTQEITESLSRDTRLGEHMEQLSQTLNVSDLIKFAKAKADSNMYEQFVDEAIDLVDNTKEKEKE